MNNKNYIIIIIDRHLPVQNSQAVTSSPTIGVTVSSEPTVDISDLSSVSLKLRADVLGTSAPTREKKIDVGSAKKNQQLKKRIET